MLTNEKLWEEKLYLLGERILVHFILMKHFGGRSGLSQEVGQKSFDCKCQKPTQINSSKTWLSCKTLGTPHGFQMQKEELRIKRFIVLWLSVGF